MQAEPLYMWICRAMQNGICDQFENFVFDEQISKPELYCKLPVINMNEQEYRMQ